MDIITHVPDLMAMNIEGQAIANDENHPLHGLFTVDDNGSLTFNPAKIPVHYTEDYQTLCLVRGMDLSDFDNCASIKPLGECVKVDGENMYEFLSLEDEATYREVRGPLDFEYEVDGIKRTGNKPFMIGVFA